MAPLVSIVTPVYNGERYLRECIESVLAQTFGDFEYLLLDNASTDGTADILHHYAQRDPRITLHRNDSLIPVIQNHNRVLSLISPESTYCKPLMADDWLFPTFLERTVAAATAHPSVGMVCALAIDGSSIVNDGFPYPGQFRAGREVARLALLGLGGRQFFGTPTTLLFRANLVRCKAKFYNEDSLLADFESALELTTLTDFSFLHEVLAFVRRHDESITSTVALRYDIAAPNDVYLIDKFGPAVLEGAELADTRNRIVKSYYRALARNFLLMRERKYWDMHRESFRKVKLAFNPLLFGRALLLELLSFVSQPRMALELVRERLRMTRGTSS